MDLNGKIIAVLGLGREGHALARYFDKEGTEADFFDEDVSAQADDIKSMGFEVSVGPTALSRLADYDVIFRSPGIKPHHEKLKNLTEKLTSLTRLFFDLWPGKIIGVTGTKGKGTTASLIKSIFVAAKIDSVLLGNIGQVDLAGIDQFDKDAYAIVELSSFQLMDLGVSPHIAVVLDVTSEHLDYHKSASEYVLAKLEIVRHQKEGDWLVITGKNPNFSKFKNKTPARVIEVFGEVSAQPAAKAVWWRNGTQFTNVYQEEIIIDENTFPLFGEHNKVNAAAAAAVCQILKIDTGVIASAISSFRNLPQRLENIGKFGGITFINDSASTNPAATAAAIDAIAGPLIPIIGGKNKGLDYSALVAKIAGNGKIKKAIVFGAIGDELKKLFQHHKDKPVEFVATLDEAVKTAIGNSAHDNTILFSPGAASFDQFTNYVVRGQKFNNLIYEHFGRKI